MTDDQQKLVIFDYSGTLSVGAVRFSRAENLLKQFDLTGLSQIGIRNVDVFWKQIVNPTWLEGSTTLIGYKKLMYRRIKETISVSSPGYNDNQIEMTVSRFVDNYLMSSKIEPHWGPLLRKIAHLDSVRVIIATDHYAEATDMIVKNLEQLDIPAITPKDILADDRTKAFIVANSANLGTHKDGRAFWDSLKHHFNLGRISALLVIDDFGANEGKKDSYGERGKVDLRRQRTIALLEGVFSVPVKVATFHVDRVDTDSELRTLFLRTQDVIKRFLGTVNNPAHRAGHQNH
jgi:hypothetical protein